MSATSTDYNFTGNGSEFNRVSPGNAIKWVTVNGNTALHYGVPDDPSQQAYFDVINMNKLDASIISSAYNYRKTGFVIDFDVMGGDLYVAKDLVNTLTRVTGSPDPIFLLYVDGKGLVYPSSDKTTPIAALSKDEYINLAVYVDIPNLKYYVYVNGVNMTPNGFTFMAANKYSGKSYTEGDTTLTTEDGEYYLNAVRFYQLNPCTGLTDDSLTFDNIRVYYTTPELGYIGEYTEKVVGPSAGILFGEDGKVVTTPGVVAVAGKEYFVIDTHGVVASISETPLGYLPNAVYTDLTDTTYIKKDGMLQGWNVTLGTMDISNYDYIAIDVYRPAEYVDTNFQFNSGQRERFYYVDFDGTNYTLRSPVEWTYSNPGGLSTIGNKTLKTADGSVSISGSLRSNSNGYYLRTWDYYQTRIALDTGLTEGWNTVTIPISNLSNSQRTNFETVSFACTGWDMNNTRSWNPEKNSDKPYPDADKCDIRFKNLRLITIEEIGVTAASGWNANGTMYTRPGASSCVTGYQVIDGKWYDFGTDGILKGLMNGVYNVSLANGTEVKRLYIDGDIMFGTAEYNGVTCVSDTATGALSRASVIGTCEHIRSDSLYYDPNEIFYNNHHYYVCVECGVKINPTEYSFTQFVSNNDATYQSDGTKTAVCDGGCGATKTVTDEGSKLVKPELKISGLALTLYDNISMNFRVDASLFTGGAYSDPYVVFEHEGLIYTITKYTEIDGYYVFTFPNVAPHRMNDAVYATLKAKFQGEEESSVSVTYSVRQYCYLALAVTTDEDAELRTLLVDILNYGAAAQVYNNHNVTNLVNGYLTETQKAWGTQSAPTLDDNLNKKYATVTGAEAKFKALSLSLSNGMGFKIQASDVTGLTVRVEGLNGVTVIPASQFELDSDGLYCIYFREITAAQMSESFRFTVYRGDTAVSNTIACDLETCAYYTIQTYQSSDTNMVNLLNAMMNYGNSAQAYVSK